MVANGRHKPPGDPPDKIQLELEKAPETMADAGVREEKERITVHLKTWRLLFVVALMLSMLITSVGYIQLDNGITREQLLENHIGSIELQVKGLEDGIASKNKELQELNDLDLKCIPEYIKSRFSKTPSVLADAISASIVKLSREMCVPIPLIVGIVETEAHFNPYAVSGAGARGLMQVMPSVWLEQLGIPTPETLHEIEEGIYYGILVLKEYLKQTKNNLAEALWMYNGKHADKKKYATKVFENVGRYILHRCRTEFPPLEED